MSKKLQNLKWDSVTLENFPASVTDNLHGFVGLEECTDYGQDKESRRPKKKKEQKQKRKLQAIENQEKLKKKVKLSNGFTVESCNTTGPSLTSDITEDNNKQQDKKKKTKNVGQQKGKSKPENKTNKENKIYKPKLGENIITQEVRPDITPEDMLSWAEFKLPESIMKALTELGFTKPTKIQQLSLPAAIHGRRDILGAAETGSGKTLAFGLPILSGILKLKEKAEAKGLDVYDIPYKKTSVKKKNMEEIEVKKAKNEREKFGKDKKKLIKGKKKINNKQGKESSEDGYCSGDDNSVDTEKVADTSKEKSDEEYVEEIVVPIKKKQVSVDEGHDSDDSDNYIHLSDMLDSDDLAETSDEEEKVSDEEPEEEEMSIGEGNESEGTANEESENDASDIDNNVESGDDESGEEGTDMDKEGYGEESPDEGDENQQGIGCVKVVDNIEIPGHTVVKTGKPLYALILTPTRELAIQISRHLIAAAKYTGIRIATIVGGMAAVKQERVLRCGPEVVVATPGRLWELLSQGQPHLQQLDSVKFLAIDETDRMIERGHFEELTPLLERLNADEARRNARQNFVFSATLTMVHELPTHMKGKKVTKRGKIINRKIDKMTPQQKTDRLVKMIGMSDPKVVDITAQNLGTAETLTESRIACSLEQKDACLYYILKRHPGRTIVFCNSIGSVKRLAQLFTMLKCRPLPLHASMPQRQRLKNLERFRDDPHGVLVATDVAARGLDIPDVDHVIHYQVPRTAENYVHRSGRTARANKEGLTILMMEPAEAYLYTKLCRTLNKTSEVPTFPVPAVELSALKAVVGAARALDALELRRRRAARALAWRQRAAREMDIIVDEDDVPMQQVDPSIDKALAAKKRQLAAMLSRPIYPRGFSFKYPTLNDPNALIIREENALQVMKNAIQSGELKKEKRKSKNAPLLKLQNIIKNNNKK